MFKGNKKLRIEEEEDIYQYVSSKDIKHLYKKEKKQKKRAGTRVHNNE